MQTYHGSCQCNCSICSKKGGVFARTPPERFRLLRGQDAITLYQFNTKVAEHYFCKNCGIHTFGHPRSAPGLYLINVLCLDDFDLDAETYEIDLFDGKNWEAAFAARKGHI